MAADGLKIGYVNVFVSNFDACCTFFTESLGLTLNQREDSFGYASFNPGTISFGIAKTDDPSLVGSHTGEGFIVDDIDATYKDLVAKGVEFEMPPTNIGLSLP